MLLLGTVLNDWLAAQDPVFRTPCLGHNADHNEVVLHISIDLVKSVSHRHIHRPTKYRPSLITTLFPGVFKVVSA